MNIGVSIIICCYNSASRLSKTLKHLALQKITSDIQWEVIIVNNNSTDNTSEVAKEEWTKYNCMVPFIIVDEPKQGLSNARKTGVDIAKFDFLIFCDDDNWLHNDYVQLSYNLLYKNNKIGIVGGYGEAVIDIDPPSWFKMQEGWYACGPQSDMDGDISKRGYVWGAGMVARKSIFVQAQKLNFCSFLSDRTGESLSSGGDSEISQWALILGYKLWYSQSLKFRHYITSKRITDNYLQNLKLENKKCDYWFNKYNILLIVKELEYTRGKNFVISQVET